MQERRKSGERGAERGADLAHVLGLGHLLADDGLFVAGLVAGAPAEDGVGAAGDMALAAILNLVVRGSENTGEEGSGGG